MALDFDLLAKFLLFSCSVGCKVKDRRKEFSSNMFYSYGRGTQNMVLLDAMHPTGILRYAIGAWLYWQTIGCQCHKEQLLLLCCRISIWHMSRITYYRTAAARTRTKPTIHHAHTAPKLKTRPPPPLLTAHNELSPPIVSSCCWCSLPVFALRSSKFIVGMLFRSQSGKRKYECAELSTSFCP